VKSRFDPSRGALHLLALTLLWPLAGSAAAEPATDLVRRNLQFVQIDSDDGLSQEIVMDLVQDDRGFVWIATQEGLNRYDGYEIRTYEHLRGDPGTLANDFVRSLFVDADGTLWVGTEVGVNRYDAATDRFDREPFAGLPDVEALAASIRTMTQTRDGAYWFGTYGRGLIRVDPRRGAVRVFRHDPDDPDSLQDDAIVELLEDRMGNLWVGSLRAGLTRYDAVLGSFVPYGDPEAGDGSGALVGREIRSLFEDSYGMLWIGTGDSGLTRHDPRRGTFERFVHGDEPSLASLPSNRVRDIVEDERGTLWIGTDSGLAEWRPALQTFVSYAHLPGDDRSLASNRVSRLFVDTAGVLWVGTWNGVSRWNYVSDTFSYYDQEQGLLPGNIVSSIAEDGSGLLWIATYGAGLASLDPVTGDKTFYRHDPDDPGSLPDDRVMAVHVDTRDRVWLGTRAAGVARLDASSGTFVRFRHDPDDPQSLSGDAITSLLTDVRGNLWVGTYGAGLNRMGLDREGRFEQFRHDPADPASLSGDRVLTLASDRFGELWIGTDGDGLNRFDAESGRFTSRIGFRVRGRLEADAAAVEMRTVTDLLQDQYGAMWIATLGQGLMRWTQADRAAGRTVLDVYGKAQGLPTDTIFGLLEGQAGALWFSSNRGLTRFDPRSGGVRQFDVRNGLRDSEFNQGARLRSRSGRMLFGGTTGLVGFFPGELPFNGRPPGLVLKASSRQADLASVALGEPPAQIEIGNADRFIAFDFVALDFTSPDKNQYRYRLQGFDPEWVEADDFRRAAYTNLPAGRYTFRLQAANNDGVWTEDEVAVHVRVVPSIWNSWWAYGGYTVVLLLLLGLWFRAQRRELHREARQRALLEQEVQARTQEIAARNSDLERLNEKLAEASVTDSLTGLRNRRYADQFIADEINRFEQGQAEAQVNGSRREGEGGDHVMFFMMIDLDGFKAINDQYGHYAGDLALVQVKDVLKACCRHTDTLIRWGGDEFLVIGVAPGFTRAKVLAERIREAVAAHRYDVGHGHEGRLSASIGIAPYPLVDGRYGFCSWELVSALADQAAYIAKANGRNAWVSLSGDAGLDGSVLPEVNLALSEFVADGRILLDSSIEGTPVLPDAAAAAPARAAAG
jgi:diguanylate cyclase (GGDEF)-like protein